MESVNSSPISPTTSSPSKSPSHPLLGSDHHHRHRGFWSSDAREEAIARGQWELMEMVKNMPESSYELSLKDLVETREPDPGGDEPGSNREPIKPDPREEMMKRVDCNRDRNKGLFLNIVMFRPSSSSSSKGKKSKKKNYGGKVSPNKVDQKERWKKGFSDGGGGESTRKINGQHPNGCCPFLCSGRAKALQ